MCDFEGNICGECGGVKFKTLSELDHDQRLIAERKAAKRAIRPDAEKHLVCTRCFTMLDSPEDRSC